MRHLWGSSLWAEVWVKWESWLLGKQGEVCVRRKEQQTQWPCGQLGMLEEGQGEQRGRQETWTLGLCSHEEYTFYSKSHSKQLEDLNKESTWFTFWCVFFFFNFKIFNSYMCSQTWTPPPTSLPTTSLWVIPMHQPQACCTLRQTWTVMDNFLSPLNILLLIVYSSYFTWESMKETIPVPISMPYFFS